MIGDRGRDPLDHPEDEVRFHIERQVDELVGAGWERSSAEAEARRRFGDPGRVLETLQRMEKKRRQVAAAGERFADLRTDLGFALRQIRRRPLFAISAVAVIALGIGIALVRLVIEPATTAAAFDHSS